MSDCRIVIGSPVDYNELVAYIYLDNQKMVIVSKEEGPDKLKVEMFGLITDKKTNKSIDFELFIKALQEAKASLLQ